MLGMIIAALFLTVAASPVVVTPRRSVPAEANVPASSATFQWGLCVYPSPTPGYKIDGKDLDMLTSNGINWIAIDFAWSEIEAAKGYYDFAYYDYLVNEAIARGIGVTGKLANTFNGIVKRLVPDWAGISDPAISDFAADYIAATVSHFKDRVKYWQVGNEENKADVDVMRGERHSVVSMEQIRQLLKKGSEAIRNADPSAYIMISVATEIPGWISYLNRVTNSWNISYDIVAVQSFPCATLRMGTYGLLEIPSLGYSIKHEIEAAKRFKDRVIVTQAGYFTRFVKSERAQADFVKYAVKGCIDGGGEGVYFYCYLDNPHDSPSVEKNFGFLRSDRTPKPAWHTYGKIIEDPTIIEPLGVPSITSMLISMVGVLNKPLIARSANVLLSILAEQLSTTHIGRMIIRHILVRLT